MSTYATVENVGEGTLVTFPAGGTLWFDSRADAAAFGSANVTVATLGGDSLDHPPEPL
ncbi:hypothetical protein [Aeromicrobium sp. Leaf272]|uniref:hypothetical protein n=1 Tax=Aeromicrobium sp. Leaf272 TaxID=1736317 RepID=UPI000AE12084|nr:hypothetical protein [Aeromicrobium sp. Leaf272]